MNVIARKPLHVLATVAMALLLAIALMPAVAAVQADDDAGIAYARDTASISKSRCGTYYRCINKKKYVKLTLKQKMIVVKVVQKGKKTKTLTKGNYVTNRSESIDPGKNTKLFYLANSTPLYSVTWMSGGKKLFVNTVKHLGLPYETIDVVVCGSYYRTLKAAKEHC